MEQIMAVLTGERAYGERLCAYANYKRNMPFTAVSFDSAAAYEKFARKHRIGVLLTDGHVEKRQSGFCESGPLGEGMIIGLFDERDEESIFNHTEGPGIDTYTLIPKYQSAEKIMRSVMSCCSTIGCHINRKNQLRSSHIAGVYSPGGRSPGRAFGLTLAKVYATKKRTLYLSFAEFSGFEKLTGETYGPGLSDAMLAYKQGSLDPEKISSLIYTYCGIEYIPPVQFAGDMKGITGDDCAVLISSIMSQSNYEAMVIDLPGSFNMAEDMMDLCDEVYVPENGDPISEARGDELEEYLDLCKKLKLKAKLHRVRLPETEPFRSMSSHIDELVYGELGDMVREYARKLE